MRSKDGVRKIWVFAFIILLACVEVIPMVAASGDFQEGDGTEKNPYIIKTDEQLYNIRENPYAHYKLGADIDLAYIHHSEEGWVPIGNSDAPFTGTFDGNGFRIRNLNVKGEVDGLGLFGVVGRSGMIKNVILEDVDIDYLGQNKTSGSLVGMNLGIIRNSSVTNGKVTGNESIGGLVGMNSGRIENSSAIDGKVTGNESIGGLVGFNNGSIENSSSNFNVYGEGWEVGGLVGKNQADGIKAEIINSYATGDVEGVFNVGGLIGLNNSFYNGVIEIKESYSTGEVNGKNNVGGLVGWNANFNHTGNDGSIKIDTSYATGNILGEKNIGGLIGANTAANEGIITQVISSYATGNVTGEKNIGGLVGEIGDSRSWDVSNNGTIKIMSTYATGKVTGKQNIGGLIGHVVEEYSGIIEVNQSYWNIDSTGQVVSLGGEGKTSEEMKQLDTYKGWDFDEVWYQYEAESYPFFQWQDPLESLKVENNELKLIVGEQIEVNISAIHKSGESFDVTGLANYSTSLEGIVEITDDTITAKKVGQTTIQVDLYDKSKVIKVSVLSLKPSLHKVPDAVNTDTINITGIAPEWKMIQITGGNEAVSGEVNTNGEFAIEVPLNKNTKNNLIVTAIADELESESSKVTILHDDEKPAQPSISIDPKDWTNADEVNVVIDQEAKDKNLSQIEIIRVKVGNENWVSYQFEDIPINFAIETEGETIIQAQAIDSIGNKSDIVETIVKIDRTVPELRLHGDNPFVIEIGTDYKEPGATAEDNVDGDIIGKIEFSGEVDVNKIGVYEIHYNVSDEAGNNALEAVREVHVVSQKDIVLELDQQAVPVYAGTLIKVEGTNASVQLPSDLPEGTTLKVESADISIEGFEQAGELLNFIFTYPNGEEEYVGKFSLTLGVDEGVEGAVIYYYNENEKTLEPIGGKIENGLITTTVNHFSIYGVFSQVEEEKIVSPKEEKEGEITLSKENKKDNPLPKTATNTYNWFLLGSLFIILATIILVINRNRQKVK